MALATGPIVNPGSAAVPDRTAAAPRHASGGRSDAHRIVARRRRVGLLVLAMALMGMTDLLCTLEYMRTSGMVELNPLARWVAAQGGAAGLIAFKMLTLGLSGGILLHLRERRVAENFAWVGVACMLALTIHWVHYNAHVTGMTPLFNELAAAAPPEWVRLP